jgi:sugar phosphate isomerase/epimerase
VTGAVDVRNGTHLPRICLFSASLPGWDAGQVIEAAVSLGISAVEWGSGRGQAIEDPEHGAAVRDLCDRARLTISGLSVQDPEVTLATPHRAARYVHLARTLGAPHVRLFPPRYRGGSLHREQQRARDGLGSLVELAGPAGVAVLVETTPDSLAPSPELAAALVQEQAPRVAGVLYDPGNMVIEGHLAPGLAVACLGRHLRHVHVKNVDWSSQGGAWRWRHRSLAKGVLDWGTILAALATARYRGGLSIDHLGGRYSRALLESESAQLHGLVARAYAQAEPLDGGGAAGGAGDGRGKGGSRSPLVA